MQQFRPSSLTRRPPLWHGKVLMQLENIGVRCTQCGGIWTITITYFIQKGNPEKKAPGTQHMHMAFCSLSEPSGLESWIAKVSAPLSPSVSSSVGEAFVERA